MKLLDSVQAQTIPADVDRFEQLASRFRAPVDKGNPIRNIDPPAFLLLLAGGAVSAAILWRWQSSLAAIALFLALALLAHAGKRFATIIIRLAAFVGLLLFLTRAAFTPGTHVLFKFGAVSVSRESLLTGVNFSTGVLALCAAVVLLFAVMPMADLMLSLEQRGLSARVTYVVLASFQSITDLGRNSRVVMDAQRARGVETEGNLLVRVRTIVPILAPTFLTAITSTEERAMALDSRAFNARGTHTHLRTLRPAGPADIAVGCTGVLLVVAVVSCKVLGWI